MGCKTITVGRHGTDVNSTEDPELKTAKDLTDGRGPDVAFDTVGDFGLTKAAFNVLAIKGRLATITAPRQGSTELAVDILSLYRRQVELIGCNTAAYPQAEMAKLMNDMTAQFENGKLKAPEESTMNLIGIDQAPDAYSGKVKRAVITFD
jgi:NADPH:quinone reductase-like Zn-dependent oxidoreductase